jgi:regulator of sigma E protease
MPFLSPIIFIVILGLLVYVHELGHFLAAKMVGVRVEEFAFGFGPRLVTLMRRGGTDYTIHAFPLGGFVNLVGMQPEEEHLEDGLMSKSRPARAFVFLAGPLMNVLLAILLFSTMGMVTGAHRDTSNQVAEVFPRTEAERAGLRAGDRLVAVDGRQISNGDEMLAVIESSPNRQLTITIERDGARQEITATPQPKSVTRDGQTRTVGQIGFRPGRNFSNEVLGVEKGSAAERAGLREGDRVVAAGGRPIANGDEMLLAISQHADQPLELTVLRGGKPVPVQATPEPQVIVAAGPQAEKALAMNLYPGEQIYKVNGRPVRAVEEVVDALKLADGPAKLTVEREGKQTEITVPLTAAMVRDGLLKREGRLGFLPGVAFERVGFVESVRMGISELNRVLYILYQIVRRNQLKESAGGPIMMARMVHMNSKFHPSYQWALAAQLSLSLAIFNLLPIPVLDGGHLALLGVEAIRRRRLDPSWHRAATAAGLVVIGILFLLLMYRDFAKWVTGTPLIQ